MKDITPEQYRCVVAECPSVHVSEDGKTLRITGDLIETVAKDQAGVWEATIDISADLAREVLKAAGGSDA